MPLIYTVPALFVLLWAWASLRSRRVAHILGNRTYFDLCAMVFFGMFPVVNIFVAIGVFLCVFFHLCRLSLDSKLHPEVICES